MSAAVHEMEIGAVNDVTKTAVGLVSEVHISASDGVIGSAYRQDQQSPSAGVSNAPELPFSAGSWHEFDRVGDAPLLMPRDLAVLGWIAEMGVADLRQVGLLLLRYDGDPDSTVNLSRVRRVVSRWCALGFAETRRVLGDRPALVWTTHVGNRVLGYDFAQRPGEPSLATVRHTLATGDARLVLEERLGRQLVAWISDRELRSTNRTLGLKHHVADGVAEMADGSRTAVEVELTLKAHDRLLSILVDLTGRYDSVLYLTNEATQIAVSRAARQLDNSRHARLSLKPVHTYVPDTSRVTGR